MITNRTVNIFNDNEMANFLTILMYGQKRQALDKVLLIRKTTPKQISPESKRQKIEVEKDIERDFSEVIMEGGSPSNPVNYSIINYVICTE